MVGVELPFLSIMQCPRFSAIKDVDMAGYIEQEAWSALSVCAANYRIGNTFIWDDINSSQAEEN